MNLVNLYSIFCLSYLFIWHLSVDMLKTCRTARPFILGHHFAPTAWDVKNLWGLALLLFGVSNGAWRFMYALSILPLLGVGYVRRHLPETRCTEDFSCQGKHLATWEEVVPRKGWWLCVQPLCFHAFVEALVFLERCQQCPCATARKRDGRDAAAS